MRTHRRVLSLLTTAAGITLSAALALPSHAQAFDVFAGYDIFQSTAGTSFLGTPLNGVPLNTFNFGGAVGIHNVGNTDTIVQRLNNAGPSVLNGTATTALQMRALSLVSATPTTFGGALPLNTYYVFLNPSVTSTGSMDITYLTATSGTFVSTLNVNYEIGTAPNDPSSAVFAGSSTLSTSGPVAWSNIAPAESIQIAGANYKLNGSTIANDFWPVPFTESHPSGVNHAVANATPLASTPEPGSIALLVTSGMCGFGLLRRRRAR